MVNPTPAGDSGPLSSLTGNLDGASQALSGAGKEELDPLAVNPDFINGQDLSMPGGQMPTIAAGAKGSIKIASGSSIEFLHVGQAFKDKAAQFPHGTLDDTALLDLSGVLGGRAIMYRAALQREAILLSSFVGACASALAETDETWAGQMERDKDGNIVGQKFGLGAALGAVGDLLGGGGGTSNRPQPAELNPFVDKIKAIAATIDDTAISYETLHKAGIDLHTVRAGFNKYLEDLVKRMGDSPPTVPSILDAIPFLAGKIPKEIGDIIHAKEKYPKVAFYMYLTLVIGYTQKMQANIEKACLDMSIDAITRRASPIFPVWFVPAPPPPPDHTLVKKPKAPTMPFGLGQGIVNEIVSPLASAADAVNSADTALGKVEDFLNRPYKDTPGGPFVDRAFGIGPPPPGTRLIRAEDLGSFAADTFAKVLKIGQSKDDLPGFLATIITQVSEVNADFMRAVYGTLVTLSAADPIDRKEMIAAARSRLLNQLEEKLLGLSDTLDTLRKSQFGPFGPAPLDVHVTGEDLIARLKELLNEKVITFLDPIPKYAMGKFADALNEARDAAKDGLTMEAYLGILPAEMARLFFHTFFPMVDLLMNAIMAPLNDALDKVAGPVGGVIKKAKMGVDTVREVLAKVTVAQTALAKGIGPSNAWDTLMAVNDAHADAKGAAGLPSPREKFFPLPGRKTSGSADTIKPEEIARVVPDLKWIEPDSGTN